MRAEVDGECVVPLLGRGALEAPAGGDADVEHDAVETAEGGDGLVDETFADLGVADVADDDMGLAALEFHEPRRLLGGAAIHVRAGDGRTFPCGELGDRPAVAHGRIGLRRRSRASADDQNAASSEPDHSAYRSSRPRAITRRWISLVPSPMIISGAS